MLTDKCLGVLMGGASAEREVSLRSGTAIYNALKRLGYNVVDIDAGPDICKELNKKKVELVFLALHGGHGENGSIQGLLEVLGIPYTGSGVLASALAMDKEASKKIFLYHDISVPPFVVVTSSKQNIAPPPPNPLPQGEGASLKIPSPSRGEGKGGGEGLGSRLWALGSSGLTSRCPGLLNLQQRVQVWV